MAAGSTALPLLYPVSGWFAVLTVLQLLLGLASALGMAASQTWAMHSGHGDTAMLARYSIATRIGTFIGPVAVGAAWDLYGAWVAFACVSVCGAGIIAATAYSTSGTSGSAQHPTAPRQHGAAVLLPRWEPHKQALLLALIPSVAFILAASFLRNSSGSIQSSLFIVYLNGIGMSGTLIGTMVAIAELAGVLGSLLAAPVERRLRANRLVILCIVVSLVAISITPLIGHTLILLIAACATRGIVQGMSQPLMYAILSHEVPGERHGASVGLRNTVVRLASIVTPAIMGVAAETWSIEASFYVIGAAFLMATAVLAIATRKMH